jgi:hypothetical protein
MLKEGPVLFDAHARRSVCRRERPVGYDGPGQKRRSTRDHWSLHESCITAMSKPFHRMGIR